MIIWTVPSTAELSQNFILAAAGSPGMYKVTIVAAMPDPSSGNFHARVGRVAVDNIDDGSDAPLAITQNDSNPPTGPVIDQPYQLGALCALELDLFADGKAAGTVVYVTAERIGD